MSVLSLKLISRSDIPRLAQYWLESSDAHLTSMGVDPERLPTLEEFTEMLEQQLELPLLKRKTFGTIWMKDGKSIGHCNVSPFTYADHAFLHLHLWHKENRKTGIGSLLLPQSIAVFFDHLKLNKIYSQPYALNPAPNKALEKIGFELEAELNIVPGSLSFKQPVNRWVMTRERFEQLYG